jgi:hypothetical protein
LSSNKHQVVKTNQIERHSKSLILVRTMIQQCSQSTFYSAFLTYDQSHSTSNQRPGSASSQAPSAGLEVVGVDVNLDMDVDEVAVPLAVPEESGEALEGSIVVFPSQDGCI